MLLSCLTAAILLQLSLLCLAREASEEVLIGWKGESFVSAADGQPQDKYGDKPWIETISWRPRAFVYHNFLSAAECAHFVDLGSKRVTRSQVVDSETGAIKFDDIRTSYGGTFSLGEDPITAAVEQRIAEWTHIPAGHGERFQILKYQDGQKYGHHYDWFDDPLHGGFSKNDNRIATILLYLSEVDAGGETHLPLAEPLDAEAQRLANPSDCAAKWGIAVRPRKGDALMFFDLDVGGQQGDRRALHASCPTLNGTKWTMTKWLHSHPFSGGYNALRKASACQDMVTDCSERVSRGECKSDPERMVGVAGMCRKSCGDCVQCADADLACQHRNLERRAEAPHD